MLDNRLVTFISLCKTRSYTKTANELFISQPGVTHHIKSLENDFKCKLFNIENKELRLTKSGELMLSFAQKQLNSYKQIQELLKNNESNYQKVRLATTYSLAEYYVNDIIKEWLKENPNDQIDVMVVNNAEAFKLLNGGMVDFIITDGAFDKEDFESHLLKTSTVSLVVGPEHALSQKKRLNLKSVLDERWFFNSDDDAVTMALMHELLIQNISLSSIHNYVKIGNDNLIKELVMSNLGIAFQNHDFIIEEIANDSLVEINVQDVNLTREIFFVYTKDNLNGGKLFDLYNAFDQLKRKAVYSKYNITQ